MENKHEKYQRLIDYCKTLPPLPTAVVHPCDQSSLAGAVEAAQMGLIEPILCGPAARINAVAQQYGIPIGDYPIVDAPYSEAAAAAAVALVREGRAEALMKGSLHTDELMGAVVKRDAGLRTGRRVSHCFVMAVPGHDDPLIITDAAVNIAPTLEDKRDILQNAIDLAHAMQFEEVRVAILSAMETVNPKVPSTIEAAALCKMVDRKQVTGAVVDGPLALDNAIDPEAARIGQHAGQEPVLPGRRRRRRHRAGRASADHPDQPRRHRHDAARLVRGGGAGGQGAPRTAADRVTPWPT
jgi:phosphate acetyltransferase